jgi:hypothetical protein
MPAAPFLSMPTRSTFDSGRRTQYPVLFVNPIPVAQLIPVTVAAAPLGYFYELRLGDPPVYNEDGEPQEAQPLESYAPAVYLITVDRGGSHGQATAIA